MVSALNPEHQYINKDGKKLRRGYTTGSSATGAAKAAVKALFSGKTVDKVSISTPAGIDLKLDVVRLEQGDNYCKASIIKDGGDDPDVTDGLEIAVKAEKIANGIEITGGQGVGRVTKPGLPVEKGQAAINPVPRKMIKNEVSKVLPDNKGVKLTVEVPKGEKVAQKTLNTKLGIKGGISILGTTGIVEPMSEEAYRKSLALKIDQALAENYEKLVLVFGNYGKKQAVELGFKEGQLIRMSNFVGYILKQCVDKGVKEVVLLGHIGKLVKVSAGIFVTHSKKADARLETIAAYTASVGGSQDLINNILNANTAEEAAGIIQDNEYDQVFDLLAKRAALRSEEYINDAMGIQSLLFSMTEGIIGTYKYGGGNNE